MADAPVISEGVTLFELQLRLPNSQQTVPLTGKDVVFKKATLTEQVNSFSTYEFTLLTPTPDYVDNLLKSVMATGTPQVRVRLGFGSATGSSTWLPWQEHIIRHYGADLAGLGNNAGYLTQIVTSDKLWEIDRVSRVTVRKGTISSIVQQIADFYKLDAIIEPTKFEGLYVQSYLSDYAFILKRMVPRAANAKSRGNYQFFIKDNVLHFHTMDYQADLKTFSYTSSATTKLTQMDIGQESLEGGAGGVRMVVHDPYSGSRTEVNSDPDKALRLGNAAQKLSSVTGIQRNVQYHTVTNQNVAEAIANHLYENAKFNIFRLELDVPNTLFFRLNDLVNLVINPAEAKIAPWSGYYQVTKLVQIVDENAIQTKVVFQRGEYLTNQNSFATTPGEDVIQPDESAPGQPLNALDTQSSNVTKGAGKTMSRNSAFLDTLNPGAAP